MPDDARDETDHDLFGPALDRLFREPLEELGGTTCRDLLSEMVESRWRQLAGQCCRRSGRLMPNSDDALVAFDAVKHTLLGDINILDLSFPELWRFVRRIKLRQWLWIGSPTVAILGLLLTVAYEIGKFAGNR